MIRQYQPEDYPTLQNWWSQHGYDFAESSFLPKIGFITEHAACFLVQAEGGLCFIDLLVSNPKSSPENRNKDSDAVIEACISHAKHHSFNRMYAFTCDKSVVTRAEKHNFELNGHYTMLQRIL